MKLKITLLSAILAVGSLSSFAQETKTEKFYSIADTWTVTNGDANRGGSNTMEIKRWVENSDAGEVVKNNVGLIGFNVVVPSGMKIQEATLNLVTERVKINPMLVYYYDNDFAESNSYVQEGQYIEEAFLTKGVEFRANGQNGKAIFDKDIKDENQSLEKWQNKISVTSLIPSKSVSGRVNFMIACDQTINSGRSNGEDVRIYTKENPNGIDAFKNSDDTFVTHFDADQIVPYLEVTFVEDSDVTSEVLLPDNDVFVRSNSAGTNFKGNNEMEVKRHDSTTYFVGLMNFTLPSELQSEDYELEKAELRIVHTQIQGERGMQIYNFPYDFDEEKETWNTIGDNVLAALANDPIATYKANGSGNKAINDKDNVGESYSTAEAWTNRIDFTEYLKENMPENGVFGVAITKETVQTTAMKIATKEIGDKTSGEGYTYAAKDLGPQLTIVYRKKEATVDPDPEVKPDVETLSISSISVVEPSKTINEMENVITKGEELLISVAYTPEEATQTEITWDCPDGIEITPSEDGYIVSTANLDAADGTVVKVTGTLEGKDGELTIEHEFTVMAVAAGDANLSGYITVADVVTVANHTINSDNIDRLSHPNADANSNGEIEIADVTTIVNMIIGNNTQNVRNAGVSIRNNDRLVAGNFVAGKESVVGVALDNSRPYSALRATVNVPEGMTVKGVTAGERAAAHELAYNLKDGRVEVVIYSFSNAAFAETEGSLFNLIVEASSNAGAITMEDIQAANAASQGFELGYEGGLEASAAGVEINVAEEGEARYYDLQGVEVRNPQAGSVVIRVANGKAVKIAL